MNIAKKQQVTLWLFPVWEKVWTEVVDETLVRVMKEVMGEGGGKCYVGGDNTTVARRS